MSTMIYYIEAIQKRLQARAFLVPAEHEAQPCGLRWWCVALAGVGGARISVSTSGRIEFRSLPLSTVLFRSPGESRPETVGDSVSHTEPKGGLDFFQPKGLVIHGHTWSYMVRVCAHSDSYPANHHMTHPAVSGSWRCMPVVGSVEKAREETGQGAQRSRQRRVPNKNKSMELVLTPNNS